tara:strand:- start:3914 stop:4375 length:462 start_codon:yes stop_codon:yes gene_type:complete
MPDRYKILSQTLPANTNETVSYTVPYPSETTVTSSTSPTFDVITANKSLDSVTQSIVSSIIICNLHSGAVTYDIRLKTDASTLPNASGSSGSTPAGTTIADNDKEMLFKAKSLATASTDVLSLGLGLSGGNQIIVQTSVASKLAFTIMGVEVT